MGGALHPPALCWRAIWPPRAAKGRPPTHHTRNLHQILQAPTQRMLMYNKHLKCPFRWERICHGHSSSQPKGNYRGKETQPQNNARRGGNAASENSKLAREQQRCWAPPAPLRYVHMPGLQYTPHNTPSLQPSILQSFLRERRGLSPPAQALSVYCTIQCSHSVQTHKPCLPLPRTTPQHGKARKAATPAAFIHPSSKPPLDATSCKHTVRRRCCKHFTAPGSRRAPPLLPLPSAAA